MLTVAVLISGAGSNLRALLEAARHPEFPARIVVVGADRDAAGLAHAEEFGIPAFTVPFRSYESRELVAKRAASGYFDVVGSVGSFGEGRREIIASLSLRGAQPAAKRLR